MQSPKLTKTQYREMARIFECASRLLRKSRWIRGTYHDSKNLPSGGVSDGYCALGAVRHCYWGDDLVAHSVTSSPVMYDDLQQFMQAELGQSVSLWNDEASTRKGDVVGYLERLRDTCTKRGAVKRG